MEAHAAVERARAVLARLRDQLLEHKTREPNPRTMVPADLAILFNDTLAELQPVFGDAWVASTSVSQSAIFSGATRNGSKPGFPIVQRDILLGYVKAALRRLNDLPATEALSGMPLMPAPATGTTGLTPDGPQASVS